MKRVGLAGLWHETNTYSARRTALADFEAFEVLAGEDITARHAGTGTVIGGMLEERSLALIPIFTAGAWPGGRVTGEALETLLERLERGISAARPLDGLLVDLHGATVAEGVDDVEAETLRLIRRAAGEVPVAVVLDLHGNPSPDLARLVDAFVAYDTYPHVDMRQRGREAAALMAQLLEVRRLRTLIRKVPLLSTPLAQDPARAPMRHLRDLAGRLSARPGIARISLLPGFPYSDVARAGFSVLVTAEEQAQQAGAEVAAQLSAAVESRGDEFVLRRPGPAEAVRSALRARRRPVVLVDVADNVGGGSPGDGTTLLRELLEQGATRAVVTIADAEAAQHAAREGVGAPVEITVGGKADERHGSSVDVSGRVVRVSDGRYRTEGTWMTGREFEMGTTAVVEVDGVSLVLMERAVPPFHSEQLESVGIDPREASILVVKGAIAWRAAYRAIAGRVIEVDTPGICPLDPSVLERSTTPMRV